MIITKLRLEEEHPMPGDAGSWALPLCDFYLNIMSGENGYILKDSSGLEPPEMVASVEGFSVDGVPILESIPEKREIVLKIGLKPGMGQTFGTLRDALYKYLSRTVLLKLMKDSLVIAQTAGFIRNLESNHFTNKPEVLITIECNDGYLVGPASIPIPLEIFADDGTTIDYKDGSAPAGVDLQFTVDSSHSDFTISDHRFWHAGSGELQSDFTITFDFLADDVVTISTHPGARRVSLLRSAVTYDLAGYLNAGAVWPKLFSGVNVFSWDLAAAWMTWDSASYIPRYWGV